MALGRDRIRMLVIALLKPSQIRYKLEPLSRSRRLEKMYLVRKVDGPPVEKLAYVTLPRICRFRPIYGVVAPLYSLVSCWSRNVDFILAYRLFPHGLFAFFASRLSGRPFIYSQIDSDIQTYTRVPVLRGLVLYYLRKAFHINVPGSNSVRYWAGMGIDPSKISVLHSTIDTEEAFYPTDATKEYDFVCVGDLIPRKRVDVVVDCAIRLVKDGHPIKLNVIGDGPEREALEQRVKQERMEDNIVFSGRKSDIAEWLNRSRIFVLASSGEGLPCALMEAMACELLAIATDVGDTSDALIDGETGFLVKDQSPDSLYRAMKSAYVGYDSYGALRRNARKKIVDEHSYLSAEKKWNTLLDRLAIELSPAV